ncbi:DNA cross-link repair protein pso2/snm1 [Cyphellophora attinorum]|uniref:DNA cross-link repair protein pso2/snm1 n=1 Tax=Cyphellophora attinorum TaxID=1664694 RepID=A0A0N1P233_9EURO|nr:DNA cross-link repair protein pso2/snm1 [Phialophora attinorum]KPI44830.1 DNA cross-link repair protein pso2/snm1 [Phialophora attinorum]
MQTKSATPQGRPKQTSLMNFFGAAATANAEETLFFGEATKFKIDSDSPVKRRRTSEADEENWVNGGDVAVREEISRPPSPVRAPVSSEKNSKFRGGFAVDSDDEDDEDKAFEVDEDKPYQDNKDRDHQDDSVVYQDNNEEKVPLNDVTEEAITHPPLVRHDTSVYVPGDFGDEEFENEEFYEQGEEFLERQWMEEQAAMEAAFDEDSRSDDDTASVRTPRTPMTPQDELDLPELPTEESVSSCPICSGSLSGLTEAQASSHVNACLDGNAPPLPERKPEAAVPAKEEPISRSSSPFKQPSKPAHRFRQAAIARPPQANPFSAAKEGKSGGSAFSKLMSGHAEDIAWAEAAANEKDSRGKPAYQRTCPFYKIMPGMYICVDAFRYGKVEGQNAYFLSHFHSDHYIGMTSSWCHGPIYASKVTCNLMRQQLRVDPKWIKPLEFDKKYEIPDTNGVRVTMLPANHCPGSSIYVFEKALSGKNKDGSDRVHRILHCGDFRACPAHVNHPLLRPNIVDTISGATKEQWIDTCYLDTTYLTPKYAFPSQSDVIDACAAMCVSLSNEIPDPNDNWEQAKSTRMGSTMSKFLEAGTTPAIKPEPTDDEVLDTKTNLKPRGRLLVVIGTYSIGKERICLGIAKALNSKIYAPPNKMKICRALEDKELNARLTSRPQDASVHMQILFEIRAETLHEYLQQHRHHGFTRVVGFRPTGWNYKPPSHRFVENPVVDNILYSEGWKSKFNMRDLVPQRGSTRESNCFGVPYSEHSSFRELTMFCCALRIRKVVPTVNVGSAKSREKMKKWIEKWEVERKKKGLFEWNEKGGSGGDTEKFEGLHYGV